MLSFFGDGGNSSFDKSKYENLTMSIKQTVLERAHYRCQKCSVKLAGAKIPNFQHINDSHKDNRPVNLKALCDSCFEPFKKKESRRGMIGNLRNNLEQIFGK